MLCLFIFGANGQENIRENHIKLKNDSSRILFDKVCMPFNKTDLLLPNPNAKDVETAIDNTNFKADRPFYIPSNPQLSSSASFLRLNVLSSLN